MSGKRTLYLARTFTLLKNKKENQRSFYTIE